MSDLARAVRAVVQDCLAVKPGEELLVVCDPGTRSIGAALRAEGEAAGAEAVLAEMAPRELDGSEPPASIAAAMKSADVVLAPTTKSLSHTAARREACAAGVRIATLPGVTEDMLARVMSADVEGLRRRGAALAELLTGASEAVLRSGEDAELRLSLEGRTGFPDDGDLRAAGCLRQPAVRRGIHLSARGRRRRQARGGRLDRVHRPGGEPGEARDRGGTDRGRLRQRGRAAARARSPNAAATTSRSSASAPTRRRR